MPDLTMLEAIRPVWLASYPRSGNTFLRILLEEIFGLATYSAYRVAGQSVSDPSADAVKNAPFLPADWRQRLSADSTGPWLPIKTHDPPENDAPAIYVLRDGREAIHSYFYYHQKYAFQKPCLTEVIAGVCQFGSWSEHYLAWRPQTRARTLFLSYEELVSRPAEVIPRLAHFLEMEPVGREIPKFEALRERSPNFFRRGRNTDYLAEWTASQIALFNQLHGAVMQEAGYAPASAGDPAGSAVNELAHSATRTHRLYLEELAKCGSAAILQEQLTQELAHLSKQVKELSTRANRAEERTARLLRRRWVRLGLALGMVKEDRGRRIDGLVD